MLHSYDVSQFHGVVFFQRRHRNGARENPYAGWSDALAGQFIDALARVIERRKLTAVFGGVDVPDFMARTEDERRHLVGSEFNFHTKAWKREGSPRRPYHVAVQWFYRDAAEHGRPGTELQFVLEQQANVSRYADQVFVATQKIIPEYYPAHAGKLAATIRTDRAHPKHGPGVQAADRFAYLLRASLSKIEQGEHLDDERQRVWNVIRNGRPYANTYAVDAMRVSLRRFRERLEDKAAQFQWSDDVLGDADD